MISKNIGWKLLSLVYSGLGLLACMPAMFAPMMFDAPGSTESKLTVLMFWCVVTLPITLFVSATLPWKFKLSTKAKWLFVLPLVHIAIAAAVIMAVENDCAGAFNCKDAPALPEDASRPS